MSVDDPSRIRAYDVYVLVSAVLFGLGAIAVVLALVFGGVAAFGIAALPLSLAGGLTVRLLFGWRPGDRSLDRRVPQEVTE
ncbi:hypothetical protein [Haloplanus salinarum]|uniref:hypothetical protein n=1 Tax=Haloplanus salinarum TaxID=1912324 RepID=UPI00214D0271|nr:hypothetical protein [Haloplanus salinarum]